MIKTVMDIIEPEKVKVRLTMIMALGDWQKVAAELTPDDGRTLDHWHPANELKRAITDAVRQVNQDIIIYPEEKPEDPK